MKNSQKSTIFFVALIIAVISQTYPCLANPDARAILLGAAAALQRHKSVEYTATMKEDYPGTEAYAVTATCKLIRDKKDSIWGGKFQINILNDTNQKVQCYYLYDLKLLYVDDELTDTITSFNPHKGQGSGIDGNTRALLRWDSFLRPKRLRDLADKINLIGMHDVEGTPCYELEIIFPEEGVGADLMKDTSRLFVSQKDSIPLLQQWHYTFQDKDWHRELRIHNYKFGKIRDISLTSSMKKNHVINRYVRDPNAYKLLDLGAVAPPIAGTVYQMMGYDSLKFDGKLTLLDFWYQDCEWCIKAFPALENIYEKYKDSAFQIIGINSYDSSEKEMKRLPKFFDYIKMGYNTLLVDKKVPASYHVNGWPSFYIIDKNGKVAFSQPGYSDDLFDTLDKRIAELLKQ